MNTFYTAYCLIFRDTFIAILKPLLAFTSAFEVYKDSINTKVTEII